tara:strand:+ start:402 stop:920 length:519 start_codon:yes stop_codon:yes gene_type:complete
MIDGDGYRANVGIILCNSNNQVFLGKRVREEAWQFPQGGINNGESPEQAMYRELGEEVGLEKVHVALIARTKYWLRYEVPAKWLRPDRRRGYKGQKQIWFLLRFLGDDTNVSLQNCAHPEFDAWKWDKYWVPLKSIIEFKRNVYRSALVELAPYLNSSSIDADTKSYVIEEP